MCPSGSRLGGEPVEDVTEPGDAFGVLGGVGGGEAGRRAGDREQGLFDRIAAVGEREALAYLALLRRLKGAGTRIDPPDALIAATALANGWTLVSRNIKHLA